jgi:hypothetical protein
VIGPTKAAGTQVAIWICLAIAACGGLGALALLIAGGGRLQVPDLERWSAGEPAWHSPPLFGRFRRGRPATAGAAAAEPAPVPGLDQERAGGDRAA